MKNAKRMLLGTLFFCVTGVVGLAPSRGTAGEEKAEEKTVVHEVQKGDNLHTIAGYYYKDPRQWKRIYSRNSAALRDANIIVPGTLLEIDADPGRQWEIPYEDFLSRIYN